MKPDIALRLIKLFHTVVWAGFAACIVAIPFFSFFGYFGTAAALIGVVLIEVLILLVNRMSCPLTGIAARFTEDRRDNFDIYLPEWIARQNKIIFGGLFLFGIVFTLVSWAVR